MSLQPPGADAGPERTPGIRPYLRQPPPSPPPEPEPGGVSELRPFVLTSGRVEAADPEIRLETQVTARRPGPSGPGAPLAGLAPELRAIVALCAEPMSVAEISARLRLHLGVTRILVGDLRSTGHLDVHTADVADPHNPETIKRVIRGLRAIS
ncbi:MAG: DUF742 domain-containing protein [Micromonosporaceae bacterium]|nr:DUF742 domain-containing protein [Micromonosporaceae bacterium]